MDSAFFIPQGVAVGRPGGGVYSSKRFVPQADIDEFGPEKVADLVRLGRLVEIVEPTVVEMREEEGRTGRVSPGKWLMDPALLEGKELDELNVMVLEIDDSIEPFDTVEEAVAQLSMDFEG